MNSKTLLPAIMALAGLAASSMSLAQDRYPSKPIRMIVPYAAGGPADAQARAVAESIRKQLGQTVIVDNRPGALTSIGHRAISEAAPDGYTFGLLTLSAAVLPATMQSYKIDPTKGFTPIAQYNAGEYAIVSNPKVPARNFEELVAYAKANPKKFNVATGGGHLDLVISLLGEVSGANWSIVRYKGVAPARLAVVAGEVDAEIDVVGFAREQSAAGKVRFIAVTGDKRNADVPSVPTIGEGSLPGFQAGFWWGFGGPPGMPAEAVKTLNAAIRAAVETPEVRAALRSDGTRAAVGTPEDFARLIADETKRWGAVARKYSITQDN
ncbi:MAG: tripartite tricarboxylate transporter substrate binding protein [Burkholderiaceae bacterium]|nr:tripartite tricarboxylate transporter substrate binding protein [Burkholderiaceae bacterium]